MIPLILMVGRLSASQIAFMITSILKDESARYPEFANDHVLSMWDQTLPDGTHPEVAAKTGTTDNFTDNWTMGYTPDVVVGVWTGNADNSTMVNSIGITGAAPIWHSIIEYVSGYCNTATDQIPCPALDLHFPDHAFPPPPPGCCPGVCQYCQRPRRIRLHELDARWRAAPAEWLTATQIRERQWHSNVDADLLE